MTGHTFLFTGIVDTMEKPLSAGEERWLRAIREHNAVVLDVVDRNGGSMLEFLGDGWMLTFTSPRDAIDAAVGIQRSHQDGSAMDGFSVRVGVHSGIAPGRDIVLASRLTHEAGPGEIVATAHVVDALGSTDDRFESGRVAHVSGLGPHLVFGVRWAA